VLTTSREALSLVGEVRVSVEPLPVASAESSTAAESPAVQLFAARARAARPAFQLTPESASLAADIARRVDGLPLAIELAAARVNVLGLAELHSIVERRLALLDGAPALQPARDALHDLVEWSYDLLHGDEKALLHQLAVHRGGASPPSLRAIAAKHGLDDAMVTYLLQALVDKSIVSVAFPGDEPRYDLLDTVREYALAHLQATGGLQDARKAHAEYFAALAEQAHAGLRGLGWPAWLTRLEQEHDNLWAALAYARDAPDPPVAARLAAGLGWYFGIADRVSEGRDYTEAALALAEDMPPALHVELLSYLCYFATEAGDLAAALGAGERGLALAATEDVPEARAMVALALAFAETCAGEPARAVALAEDARTRFEELGNRWGEGLSAFNGALGALGQGDLEAADALVADAVRLNDGYDIGAVPAALIEGWLAERRGDTAAAAAAYRRALAASERAGFTDHASFALVGLGGLAFESGDFAEAETSYRRALTVAGEASAPLLVAQAKTRLAQLLEAAGDADAASTLYVDVLEWSEEPRRHGAREALFVALAGNPAAAASAALRP
jgi:predicted ATPase